MERDEKAPPEDARPSQIEETRRLEGEALGPEDFVLHEGFLTRTATFRSLGYPDYRYFWIGALLSNVGTWMQNIAQGALVVFVLHGTAITVGVLNFASSLPVFFLSLFAGVVADHVDRRRMLMWLQVFLLIQAVVLGYLTQVHVITLTSLLVIVFAAGIFTAFMFPAWQAMLPDLVPRTDLMNAIALNSAQFQSARFVGPAIASLLLAYVTRLAGEQNAYAAVFYINGLSFLTVIGALAIIHPKQHVKPRGGESAMQLLTGGLRYARENRCVAMYLATVAGTTLFGFFYVYLLPVLAKEFGIGAGGLGYLMACSGVGAVGGALFMARLPHETRKDMLVKLALLVLGVLLIGLGLSRTPLLSAVLLVGVGASMMVVTSSCNTAIQSMVPNRIRGRIMALFVLSFMGLMPFSSLLGGALGEQLGVGNAIAIGAVALLALTGLLFARPSLLFPCEE